MNKELFEKMEALICYHDGSASELTHEIHDLIQANHSWLFPDMGDAEEVFETFLLKWFDETVNVSQTLDEIRKASEYKMTIDAMRQYAAQEVAKFVAASETLYNKQMAINGQTCADLLRDKQSENESLKQRVKELEEEQYVVSGNRSIQAKLDMFTNALIYIKNKGYEINDSTGNSLGYIAQQALMASYDVKEGQWGVREMECTLCEKKWVAVFPIECTELECPNCNKLNQIED